MRSESNHNLCSLTKPLPRIFFEVSSSQAPREPPLPVVAHAQNAVFAVVVTAAVVTAWIAEDGREKPESCGCPGGNRDTKGDDGREEVDDDQHGCAVALRRIERVDEVQLQVEGRCKEGGELGGERGTVAAEAQGI